MRQERVRIPCERSIAIHRHSATCMKVCRVMNTAKQSTKRRSNKQKLYFFPFKILLTLLCLKNR